MRSRTTLRATTVSATPSTTQTKNKTHSITRRSDPFKVHELLGALENLAIYNQTRDYSSFTISRQKREKGLGQAVKFPGHNGMILDWIFRVAVISFMPEFAP